MYAKLLILAALASQVAAQASSLAPASASYAAQKSPVFPSNLTVMTPVSVVPTPGATIPTASLSQSATLTGYPPTWTIPPTDSPEVQAAIAAIDWTLVPNSPVKTVNAAGNIVLGNYSATDPDCWWSDTNCVVPKVSYLPPDIYYCPRPGDWGLTYDDGPLNYGNSVQDDPYAEPNLYNFLAAHNQTATLFYIGSNVWGFPQAAQRAIADGHVICVHTWSHHPSTSLTSNQMVAEFYWTLKVIKETMGITPKCWRPPYGDVDDRIRGIAWQMGMRTIIWDEDTNDWNMPGSGGGTLSPATVDGYFQGWITAYTSGNDTVQGHIVLEHELNNATVSMAEKWLPTLQQTFKVVTVQQCMNISQPYWETNFVYPTEANPVVSISSIASSSSAATTAGNAASTTSTSPTPTISVSASKNDATNVASLSFAALVLPVLVIMMMQF